MPPRPPDPINALPQPPHPELDSTESGSAVQVVHTADDLNQPRTQLTDAVPAQQEEDEDSMGQNASSQQHLVQLQEQLEQSVMRSTTDLGSICSFTPVAVEEDDDDALTRTPRQRSRTAGSDGSTGEGAGGADDVGGTWSPGKGKKRSKTRPASSYIPSTAWAGQLSSLAFPSRAANKTGSRPSSSPSPTGAPSVATITSRSTAGSASSCPSSPAAVPSSKLGGAGGDKSQTASRDLTPPRSRSSSVDPPTSRLRRSPRPSPTAAFRHSLRLPFLPSIPASPLPTLSSPGLTRSASSPPLLPPVETAGPLSPSFALIPPTASLRPEGSGWPTDEGEKGVFPERAVQHRSFASSRGTATSASAPNLSLLASAPIDEPAPSSAVAATVEPTPSTSSSTDSPYFPPSTSPLPPLTSSSPSPSPSADSPADDPLPDLQYSPGLLIPPTPTTPTAATTTEDEDEDGEEEQEEEEKVREKKVVDEKRYHALVELVETERGYLEGLRVLVKVYFQTLPFLTLLSVSEVHAVIRNADQLLALHERIGERIEQVERELGWRRDGEMDEEKVGIEEREKKRMERERPARVRRAAKRIAEVFSDELPSFELYNDFCARHAEALDITRSIASRPEWEAYERQCASRATGENASFAPKAPKNARQNSYPFNTAPAVSSAPPLPFSSAATPASSYASTPYSTVSSAAATPAPSASAAIGTSSSSSSGARSKLRFVDYAISPVQRITRYPLVFGQLDKYFSPPASSTSSPRSATPHPNSPAAAIRSTWEGFRAVASAVDAAKRQREGEMRTRVVARRMEFNTPLVGGAFCDVLGPTLLVGAMHVLHYTGGDGTPSQATGAGRSGSNGSAMGGGGGGGSNGQGGGGGGEVLKVKYYGCFLYRTHVVMAKIRKRASYEPREWLPLRLFEVSAVEEGQGFLTNSIRLSFREHHFELGALCKGEKAVWLAQLLAAQAEARSTWDGQDLDERGQPTLFDDTVVSSVPAFQPSSAAPLLRGKSHSRTTSSASVASVFSAALSTSPYLGATDEPLPPLPADLSATANGVASPLVASTALVPTASTLTNTSHSSHSHSHHGPSNTTPQFASRSRFSTTASSLLLGRTPSSQRAAVDLRLGDVFSESLLSARAQAARDGDENVSLSAAAAKRMRTVSGPKRSMTALTSAALPYAPYVVGAGTAARMLSAASSGAVPVVSSSRLERRRMSSVEVDLGAAGRAEFRGAIGFDAGAAVVYRDDSALPSSTSSALTTSPLLISRALPAVGTGSTPEKGSWARALKKGKGSLGHGSGNGAGKHRPALPEIDTALAESMARSSAGSKRGMSTPLSAGGSWSRRSRNGGSRNEANGGPSLGGQLRRVASHNSLDTGAGGVRMPHTAAASAVPTMLVLPVTPSSAAAAASSSAPSALPATRTTSATDVERNNSVSSSSSSNETGTRSSSSHVSRFIETPPSSIPPSPDFGNIELVDPLAIAGAAAQAGANKPPTFSTSPATPQRANFSGPPLQSSSATSSPRSVLDGMSSVFRIRRRKSTLGLVPPAVASLSPVGSPSASQEHLSIAPAASRSPTLVSTPSREEINLDSAAAKKALKLQRRASTTLTGLFSAKKRAQSSSSLAGSSGYFSSAAAFAGTASTPHLPLGGTSSYSSYSTSPPSSAAPSAYTSPATSPPVSQPPTPGGGVVMDLPPIAAAGVVLSAQQQPVALSDTKGRRLSVGSSGGGALAKARRGFWGMGMTPMS